MLLSKQASELGVTSKSNYEVRLYIYIYAYVCSVSYASWF